MNTRGGGLGGLRVRHDPAPRPPGPIRPARPPRTGSDICPARLACVAHGGRSASSLESGSKRDSHGCGPLAPRGGGDGGGGRRRARRRARSTLSRPPRFQGRPRPRQERSGGRVGKLGHGEKVSRPNEMATVAGPARRDGGGGRRRAMMKDLCALSRPPRFPGRPRPRRERSGKGRRCDTGLGRLLLDRQGKGRASRRAEDDPGIERASHRSGGPLGGPGGGSRGGFRPGPPARCFRARIRSSCLGTSSAARKALQPSIRFGPTGAPGVFRGEDGGVRGRPPPERPAGVRFHLSPGPVYPALGPPAAGKGRRH